MVGREVRRLANDHSVDFSKTPGRARPGILLNLSFHRLEWLQLAGLVRDAAYSTEAVPLAALRRPPRTALPRPLVARGAAAALGLPSKLYRGTRAAAADRR